MMVTVPLCVGRGNGNGISNVKVKSRNELVLGRAISPDICEQSFSVQIRHGSGNKTLSTTPELIMQPKRTALRRPWRYLGRPSIAHNA